MLVLLLPMPMRTEGTGDTGGKGGGMRMGGGMGEGGKGLERRGRVGEGGVAMFLRVGLLRVLLLVEGVVVADVAAGRAGVMALAWLRC